MRDGQGVGVEDVPVDEAEVAEAPEVCVGDRLREARTAAGMTLEQVSATTRIRVPLLRELEADRLGPPANAVYTRGHIRAIAAAVGVDPAPIVEDFDARIGASPPSLPVVSEPVPSPRRPAGGLAVPVPAPPDRTSPRWLVAGLAGAAVLVALLAVDLLAGGPDREPEQALTRTQAESTPTPQAPTAAPAPAPAAAVLDLRATGRSWLSVRNRGGAELFSGTVDAGWTSRFEDPVALTVRVGNAAAMSASCAGAPVPPGAEGQPVTLRCVPEGLVRQ